jgi:hypothetical protein
MKNKPPLKRIGASLAAAGLLSGLALTSGAALVSAAGIGPVYPTLSMTIDIDPDTGNVVVLNGQTLEITTSASISGSNSIWEDDPEEFSAEEFGAPTPDAGLTVVSTTHTWSASGSGLTPCNRNSSPGAGQTFSIATLACKADINYLQYYKVITVTNTSGSTKNIEIDSIGNSLLADGVEPDPMSSGAYTYVRSDFANDENGVVIPSNFDGSIQLDFPSPMCFTDDVEANDVLNLEKVFKVGTVGSLIDIPQATDGGVPPSMPYYSLSGGLVGAFDGSTYTVTSNTLSYLYIYGNMQLNSLDSIGDTIEASIDITDDTGASKLSDDCGGGGGGISTYPTLSALASGSTPGKGTLSAAKALPAGMPNGGFGNGAVAGPNGDVFYYGMDASGDSPKAVVSRIGPKGNMKLAGSTKLSQTIGEDSMVESFGWYGTGGSNYALVTSEETTYTIYYGKTANAKGKSSKTITRAKLIEVCGSGYFPDLNVLSAPTTSPLVALACFPEDPMSGKYFFTYGKLVTATGSTLNLTLFEMPEPTTEKPCSYLSVGVNSRAKGTQAAVFLYGAIGPETTPDGVPYATCAGTSASDRKLITVSANMVPKTKTLATGVFGDTEGDLRVAPGKKANTWIVMAHSEPINAPTSGPTKGYAVSATGQVVPKRAPTLRASGTIAAPGVKMDYLEPIKELGNGQWLVKRSQAGYGMSMTNAVAIAKYNPATGAVTTGSVLLLSGYSYPAGKYINATGISSTGVMSYYVLTEANKYKIATWKSYTN